MNKDMTWLLDTNHWKVPLATPISGISLADEAFLEDWRRYQKIAADQGILVALKKPLRQLYFPISKGISQTSGYQAVTKKGANPMFVPEATGLPLKRPESIRLLFYPTLAGNLPVLEIPERSDFVQLVQAMAHRNEPTPIPASMGACMIKGYNNWDRVEVYKKEKGDAFDFNQLKAEPALYRDVFLLITKAPYSAVPAKKMGLASRQWLAYSNIIRLAHEGTHYETLRLLGSAKNHLLDEFVADYRGIVAALGVFNPQWLLQFWGIGEHLTYEEGGRMKHYLKDVSLSTEDFREVMACIHQAAQQLEAWGHRSPSVYTPEGRQEALFTITQLTLRQMASGQDLP